MIEKPKSAEPEEIELVWAWSDFDAEDGAEDEDDAGPCTSRVMVLPEGKGRFRISGPASLTPFGPHGPFLDFGAVIRAKRLPSASYRLAEIVVRPATFTWILPADQKCLEDPQVESDLAELIEAGCQWEWCAGNLTIQKVRLEEEASPSDDLLHRIRQLGTRLGLS